MASENWYIDYFPLYEICTHQGAEAAIEVFLERFGPSIPRSTEGTAFAKQRYSPVDAVECEEIILEAFAK